VDGPGNRKGGDRSLVAEIAYHDYVALFCAMDAEWSVRRRRQSEAPNDVESLTWCLNDFAARCRKYSDDVRENYAKFCRGNQVKRQRDLAPYLFNPISLIPFGHADSLSIVLLDDFDPVHCLTCEIRTTLEEVSLGLCPKLESLDLHKHANLSELHHLIGEGQSARGAHGKAAKAESGYPPLHRFQDSLPLVAFTRYKMDGLAVLGQAVLFQQALFRAIGQEIQRVLDRLVEAVDGDKNANALMRKEDIRSLKCVLLDLQGAEEIGTLIFCRNFSVAMAVVLALRSMTFQQVFDTIDGPRLLQMLETSDTHSNVLTLSRMLRTESPVSDPRILAQNHTFRWTCTSLAVSPRAFFEPHSVPHHGMLEAAASFQMAPGHRAQVEDCVFRNVRENPKPASADTVDRSRCYRCTPGMTDLIVQYGTSADSGFPPLLPVGEALQIVAANVQQFGRKRPRQDQGRDVIEISTSLTIPVLKCFTGNLSRKESVFRPFGKAHFAPLGDVLPHLQKRLCFPHDDFGRNYLSRRIKPGANPGRLDFRSLKEIPRLYGVPVALRRTIEYLYLDFATLIADPFMFDVVLDLYDTFATLHETLTEHLPEVVWKESGYRLGLLDARRTEQLAKLVQALHNALMHRVSLAYPEGRLRDMAIDYRGGLNQVLLAADAPVKCGLGLLRRYVLAPEREQERHIVGAVTSVGFIPGAKSHSLCFGTEDKVKLAYFEVDVPHVLHVPSYCDNLHECFHLVFEGLRTKQDSQVDSLPSPTEPMGERLAEVFAALMSHLLIFPRDRERYWYYSLSTFSKSQASTGRDDCGSLVRFTEFFLRLFIAADGLPQNADRFHYPGRWPRRKETLETAYGRFQETMKEFGPFYSEYRRLWEGPNRENAQDYIRRQFEAIYPTVHKHMPIVWKEAVQLCKRFFNSCVLDRAGHPMHSESSMRMAIRTALAEGRPLVSSLLRIRERSALRTPRGRRARTSNWELDPLLLVCAVLQEYVPELDNIRGKAIHLFRDPEYKTMGYPRHVRYLKDRGQPWYEFQVDKGSAEMFCSVPDARRIRLRKEIAVLKTLWDLSSKFRARRLNEIITENFRLT